MTLQFICTDIEGLRLRIRWQQKEVLTLQRSGIGAASAELRLARMQGSVDALCIKRAKLVALPGKSDFNAVDGARSAASKCRRGVSRHAAVQTTRAMR